jgi:4-amino-4-deoxy-L-arabinose transferase-like glycosyltransferase
MEKVIKQNNWLYSYRYFLAFTSLAIVYFFNMFVDIMDIDAAQYASISMEMLQNGSYLEVFHRGADYLDKPPMLFWLSSISLGVFGINSFAYKLPAILVLILGIYSTYRFTLLWYDRKKALFAALILATTQAYFLMTNDVRTDGMLTGFVIFSVWQLSLFLRYGRWKNLVLGSIGVAFAMMTKGPLGIVLVAFAIGGDLLLKREWKNIFKWQWLVFLGIIALLLIPMTYGLYMQFDLHPEKEVYGLKGPSGVRFFYWTQSFGRITGENYWKNDAGFFFFFHTILWDFQPWIFFLIPALFKRFRTLILSRLRIASNVEFMSFFGFVLGFLALSKSGFKLPHYIFPLFPFAAIFTADFIASLTANKLNRRVAAFQFGFLHLFFIISAISFIYFFSPETLLLPIIVASLLLFYWITFIGLRDLSEKIVLSTVVAMFSFGLVLSSYFYPHVLKYQAASQVGKEISARQIPEDAFYLFGVHAHSLDFYAKRISPWADYNNMKNYPEGTIVYTDQKGMEELCAEDGPGYKILKSYDDYYVTAMSFEFLLKDSRSSVLSKKYLVQKTR